MRQFITIAGNAFMELIRQPVFLLLMTVSSLFEVFLACVNYFGFGDEPKLIKNSALAAMLLTGLFGAVLSASSSVAREIRSGTALAVLKPNRWDARNSFWPSMLGYLFALSILTFVNCIAALLATRMAFDARMETLIIQGWRFSADRLFLLTWPYRFYELLFAPSVCVRCRLGGCHYGGHCIRCPAIHSPRGRAHGRGL